MRHPSHTESKGEKIVRECQETGEPYFVFRAKDLLSPMVLSFYAKLTEDYGGEDASFQESILHARMDMIGWQREHADRLKFPD